MKTREYVFDRNFEINDAARALYYDFSKICGKDEKLTKEVLLKVCDWLMDEHDPMESNEFEKWSKVKKWIKKDKINNY